VGPNAVGHALIIGFGDRLHAVGEPSDFPPNPRPVGEKDMKATAVFDKLWVVPLTTPTPEAPMSLLHCLSLASDRFVAGCLPTNRDDRDSANNGRKYQETSHEPPLIVNQTKGEPSHDFSDNRMTCRRLEALRREHERAGRC
jgi:hypothetical protein